MSNNDREIKITGVTHDNWGKFNSKPRNRQDILKELVDGGVTDIITNIEYVLCKDNSWGAMVRESTTGEIIGWLPRWIAEDFSAQKVKPLRFRGRIDYHGVYHVVLFEEIKATAPTKESEETVC